MFIKEKKKNKKILYIFIILILLLSVSAVYYLSKHKFLPTSDQSTNIQSEHDKSNSSSNATSDESSIDNTDTRTDQDSTKLDDNATTSTSLTISIKSFSQTADDVKVSASATGAVTGTCIFTFSGDESRPVSRTIETSDGNCSTSIPAVEFDRVGTWKLTVTFYQKSTEKAEDSRDVTIS